MPPVESEPALYFSHFELHPGERVLRVHGEPMVLGSRAFDLLLALARRHERVVSKHELLDLVWPGLMVEENNIATQIGTLRKLLGAGAIATIAGRGYRLTAAVRAPPAVATPAHAAEAQRHNLPASRNRFIGREAALADLARLMPETRLLTLIGIGGCGKTRLALQLAQQQLADCADAVWFVDLAPLQEATRVASACAAVLGLREEGEQPLVQRLLRHLAARRVLLVLDNCEHVIDGVIPLVEALLAGAAGTTILATSREALGLDGEQIYPVRSLSLPATGALDDVLAAESVRVFVDRARLVWPDFGIDADNAAPVAEICRRLDGIVLAIELAAARVTMLSVAQIAERLDDRFRLLTGGSRAVPRHQTLQAAMQWSYEQLAPQERRMLRQVSVFAGGWTLRAAAEVTQCADDYEALALLTALHDKSLLVVDRDTVAGRPRYRMLETVRQYALERLNESDEGAAIRDRHVDHFVSVAEEAEPHLRGPQQDAWLGRLRQEHENLVVALTWCSEPTVDVQMGLRLAAATSYYWVWNSVELGHRLAGAVLARDGVAADTAARAGTLIALARASLFRGRYEEALSWGQQAQAVAQRIGEPRLSAWALGELGSALNTAGRLEESLHCFEQAVALARQLGGAVLLVSLLNNLAETNRSAGNLDAAERCYREALTVARVQSGRLPVICLLNNLIRVQVARRQPASARRFAIECLPLAYHEKIGVDLLEATVGLASCLGEHDTAARFFGAADRTLREWGYRHQPVDIQHTAPWLAASRRALGDARFDAAEAAGRALTFDAAMRELEEWLGSD